MTGTTPGTGRTLNTDPGSDSGTLPAGPGPPETGSLDALMAASHDRPPRNRPAATPAP
jgi:hypothetical protein